MQSPLRRWMLLLVLLLPCTEGCSRAPLVYYVAPQGDDRNDGRTPQTAWKTVGKANSTSMAPGDRILFARGGNWREALQVPSSGTAANPIQYGAFGEGADPIIDLGGPLPGWQTPGSWNRISDTVWSIQAAFPGRMWFDGREYGISGMEESWARRGPDDGGYGYMETGTSTPNRRFRYWHDGAGTLRVYAVGRPDTAYHSIEISNVAQISIVKKHHVRFSHLDFRRGDVCIELLSCHALAWDSCALGWGTNSYVLWAREGSDSGKVRGCIVDRGDTVKHTWDFSGGTHKIGANDGIAIQWGSDWEIMRSHFIACGHAGVSISGEMYNGQVRESHGNRVHDCEFEGGGDYDRPFGIGARANPDYCSQNEFYRNYFHDLTTSAQISGADNLVYYNIFARWGWIPYNRWYDRVRTTSDSWRSAMVVLENPGTIPRHNQILNNTFYQGSCAAVRIDDGKQRAVVANNLFVDCGILNNPFTPHIALSLWKGFATDTIRNNLIYSRHSTRTVILNQYEWGGGNTWRTVQELNNWNGTNGNVISGNFAADPQLQPDFRIPQTSPARDAGHPLGLAADYFGTPIPHGKPDIGACEVSSTALQPASRKAKAKK